MCVANVIPPGAPDKNASFSSYFVTNSSFQTLTTDEPFDEKLTAFEVKLMKTGLQN